MTTERLRMTDMSSASAIKRRGHSEDISLSGFYTIECRDKDGHVKWVDTIENLVTTVGKNTALDTMFGPTAPVSWYIGLIDNTSLGVGPAVGDTMLSHAGWAENANYSQSTRIIAVFAAAAAGEKALTEALGFSISVDGTDVAGCFLASSNTKSGTTGTLYSAGLFTNGAKVLDSGDTLAVAYTARA
jgi:hypothetical protein